MLTVASIDLSMASLHIQENCYKFVNCDWAHLTRTTAPDQGFEEHFRAHCRAKLPDWRVSQHREMQLGLGLDSASGVGHETDIIAEHNDAFAVLELKNRQAFPPDKNDIIVFFAKLMDYLALHPELMLREVCPIFMSNYPFQASGLAACLGLGIHPIAPGLRPLPILLSNAGKMIKVSEMEVYVSQQTLDELEDLVANLNSLSAALQSVWLSSRCGYGSESTLILRSVGGLPTLALGQKLYQVNADCTRLLPIFQTAYRNRTVQAEVS